MRRLAISFIALIALSPATVWANACKKASPIVVGAAAPRGGLLIPSKMAAECLTLKQATVPALEAKLLGCQRLHDIDKASWTKRATIFQATIDKLRQRPPQRPSLQTTLIVGGIGVAVGVTLGAVLAWKLAQ